MKSRDILLALVATFFWGTAFVAIKFGLRHTSPLVLCALRFLFTAIPIIFIVQRPNTPWRWVVMFGMCVGVLQFGMLFTAMQLGMPGGLASVVIQSQVFFTILLAAWMFKEPVKRWTWIGGAIAIAGVTLIATGFGVGATLIGFLLTLAAAVAWAFANMANKFARNPDPVSFVAWASLVAPIPLLLLSLAIEGSTPLRTLPSAISLELILVVAFLAWPATIVAFGIWSHLLGRHSAATVMPFALLVPVFGLSSTAIMLGERFTLAQGIGSALVLGGLAVHIFGPRLSGVARTA